MPEGSQILRCWCIERLKMLICWLLRVMVLQSHLHRHVELCHKDIILWETWDVDILIDLKYWYLDTWDYEKSPASIQQVASQGHYILRNLRYWLSKMLIVEVMKSHLHRHTKLHIKSITSWEIRDVDISRLTVDSLFYNVKTLMLLYARKMFLLFWIKIFCMFFKHSWRLPKFISSACLTNHCWIFCSILGFSGFCGRTDSFCLHFSAVLASYVVVRNFL